MSAIASGGDDETFRLHEGGKVEMISKVPALTEAILGMVYTPGVARVCEAIRQEPLHAHRYTIKGNTVAVVSDGSAVLGLGNIGPAAAMPVMEGKALLMKTLAGVDGIPICLDCKEPSEIVSIVKAIAPTFGGILLEDISSPQCFDIETELRRQLDIPVFHDDQHGTAVVVLAALINALKLVGKHIGGVKIVVNGVGAAGVACTKILLSAGARHVVGCDRLGALHPGRQDELTGIKKWYAESTNRHGEKGQLRDVLADADVFIGVSAGGLLRREDLERMRQRSVVFALANPVPEIMPEQVPPQVAVVATGRSDYPNQINNVLCFPGIFRGALNCRASEINEEMKLAAAHAIADLVSAEALMAGQIVPSVFDRRVSESVARATEAAAMLTGVARTTRLALATGGCS